VSPKATALQTCHSSAQHITLLCLHIIMPHCVTLAAACAGLAQFIKPEQLAGSLVCVASNLKPAKLAGQPSEAMVLAAEATDAAGQLIVRTLLPPGGL
jgi:hypothetical protein